MIPDAVVLEPFESIVEFELNSGWTMFVGKAKMACTTGGTQIQHCLIKLPKLDDETEPIIHATVYGGIHASSAYAIISVTVDNSKSTSTFCKVSAQAVHAPDQAAYFCDFQIVGCKK